MCENFGWPMKRFVKITFRCLAILFGLILLLWGVVVSLIATPEVLTPQVVNIAQQHINSEISIKSVDLSLFTRFPNITLRIDSLRITQTKDSIGDLLFARQCRVAVDPVALLFKKLVINHFSLQGASLYIYVDSLHGPLKTFNLPLAQEEEEEVQDADSLSSFDLSDYTLALRRFKIDSTQIIIDDRTREFYTRVDDLGFDISMNLSSRQSNLNVQTAFSNLLVWNQGDILVKKTSMELRSKMRLDMDSMKLSFDRARLKLNGIDLKARGKVRQDSLGVLVDVRSSLNSPSLAEFLELVPSSIIDGKDKISTQGSVALDLEVIGLYAENSLPTVGATLKIEDAKAKYASRKLSLDKVNCDAYMHLDFNTPVNSYAQINSFQVNTSGIIDLNVSGRVSNVIENPNVDIKVKSEIDFDRFSEVFPLNEGIICSGTNVSDIKTQFKMSDIENSNYANLYIEGESQFHNLEISFDASKFAQDTTSTAYLYMQAETGQMMFGDNVLSDNNSRTLRSKADFSGIGYKAKTGEYVSIKNIELMVGANFDRNTSEVNGVGIRGIAQMMDVGVDSLFSASLESSDVSFSIAPKNQNHQTIVKATVSSQQIKANEPTYNSDIALSSVNMNVEMQKNDEEQWGMNGTVSFVDYSMFTDLFPLEIKIPKTSVTVGNKMIYLNQAHLTLGSSEIVATGYIKNLIRKLFIEPRSALNGELSITSPYMDFSELIEASNSSVLMLESYAEVETAAAEEGEAQTTEPDLLAAVMESEEEQPAEIEVEVEASEPAAIEPEIEVVAQEVAAESVDSEPAEQSAAIEADNAELEEPSEPLVAERNREAGADSLSKTRNRPDSLRREPPSGSSTIFLVPRRMSFVFDLNIDKALFESATIENIEGRATLKDGVLSLDKLSLNTIGAEATGSMKYRNLSRNSANIAANISLVGVDINRIGELLPSMITMFPMLQSFEGSVDYDAKLNTNIVENSEIDMSTLRSAMMFKGTNLVLMDSETFDDLSKTLMFKNKDRNLIDSVEAYALVNESTIDVLPFTMVIDRYEAIIGGSQVVDPQTFDVDYKYNVSIIKSPLPFKAGVDITGDLNDFKFKVTTAKLKNTDFDEQKGIYEEYRDAIEE